MTGPINCHRTTAFGMAFDHCFKSMLLLFLVALVLIMLGANSYTGDCTLLQSEPNRIRAENPDTPRYEIPDRNSSGKGGFDLSIVVPTRIDDYGGNSSIRFAAMIRNTSASFPNSEIFVVEWGTNGVRDLVPESLKNVWVILVPENVTTRYPFFMEYVAKNIGIRRSSRKYILTINQDALFPVEMVDLLNNGELHTDVFYRVDRIENTQGPLPVSKKHEDCNYMCDVGSKHPIVDESRQRRCPQLHPGASGDFILASRKAWDVVGGFKEAKTNEHLDTRQLYAFASYGIPEVFINMPCAILHQSHSKGRKGRHGKIQNEYMSDHDARNCIRNRLKANHPWLPPSECMRGNTPDWGHLQFLFETIYLRV